MPFFFDLSSLIPIVEKNPFSPVTVEDKVPEDELTDELPAEELVDTGLPIPSHYDIDFMRAMVQDPFHLFVHWQLKENPFDKLRRIFSQEGAGTFTTVLKLSDETNNISVLFDAAFAREYWFSVFPDRVYRVELGVRSPQFGYVKLLSSQPVTMPRGGPSDQTADEAQYQVSVDEYTQVLRDSHFLSERARDPEQWLSGIVSVVPEGKDAQAAIEETLPESFRRVLSVITDIHAGRDYDRLWERLNEEELSAIVHEFLETMSKLGKGEMGYMLLLRYLPELLRRAIHADGEIQIDEPISIYVARKMGLGGSEAVTPEGPEKSRPRERAFGVPWNPSATT